MLLGILGTTAFLLDDGPDDSWGKPRERAVLATLLVHANEVVPLDELVRWVWPKDRPAPLLAGPTFDIYAARIRRVLARLPSAPELSIEEGGYRLTIDPALVDLHEFRVLLDEARELAGQHPARAVELVEQALWLWRGLPLADLVTEPARAWRERVLHDEWLAAHTLRMRAFLDLERHEAALAALDELLADFPDDLGLAKLRLTALYQRRRFAEATRYFLATWHRLRRNGHDEAAQLLRQHNAALTAAHPAPLLPEPTVVPRRLPDDITDFVGRRDELAALDRAGVSGVFVLDGPGGVGKTALAVHWAHRMRERFPDGDLYLNMRGSQVGLAALVDDFLVALGQPPAANLARRQRERLLRLLLADRRVLVVLDDVQDAATVRQLVELLPSCLMIVTSRRRLSVPSARRIAVRPMSPESAALLLSVRAHGRIPDAARLSAACGGLPVLVTVLAGQLAGESPERVGELVTRLDRRRLLAAVGPDGPVAVQAGEACLNWAYHALAEPERRLFRLLAVHPGEDISAEAAYACDGRTPTESIRSLLRLVAANLLRPSDELDRFGRHAVLAEFAARRLEDDESAEGVRAARERLLEYFVTAATSAMHLACPGDAVPRERVALFADAHEALAWFARERFTLAAAMHDAYDDGCHGYVRRLADPVAALLTRAGNIVESRVIRQLAVDSAHAAGVSAAEALRQLGAAHLLLEEHGAAERCLTAAARMAPADDLRCGHVSMLDQLGQAVEHRDDRAAALTLFQRGLAVAERADDLAALCWLHCRIGQVLRLAERMDEALGHLRAAHTTASRAGESAAAAASLAEIGGIHRDLGDCSAAFAYCQEALAIAEAVPDQTAAALICTTLATIGWESRRFDQAVAYSRRGVELLRGSQDLATQAQVATVHGDALYHSGERYEAMLMWRQAADLYDHAGFPLLATRLRSKTEEGVHGSAPRARAEAVEVDETAIRQPVHGATIE
ncbi:BTAD domain-containing putative transcriptional regulator [Actinophytocola sp.]|uniref:BTAD domain-containing putative transcriptional regulator n=1 Tax=Actinophytocola sp. TaxID=1872138 RepID=UPI002D5F1E3A|nr:BTAD domain-containing putative transcriptional regulator [Actinophytocola sp.]HYQ64978.1 BTAD domain-containing putative transcriptional regulator [Actinophytocola sp.]